MPFIVCFHALTVCTYGRWGWQCREKCNCGDHVQVCDPVTGCTICLPGWDAEEYNCMVSALLSK